MAAWLYFYTFSFTALEEAKLSLQCVTWDHVLTEASLDMLKAAM